MENPLLRRFLFRDLDPPGERWYTIHRYNEANASQLPVGAKQLAFAEWHYNASDRRCPDDSWIQSIDFGTGNTDSNGRNVTIRLLGAYHDRVISFEYSDVTDIEIQGQLVGGRRHNLDWLYDEIHLSDSGTVEHLIEFELSVMRIRCADLTVTHLLIEGR